MAFILKKHNLVFLHPPKTGGNWLTKVFRDQNLIKEKIQHKHATYDLLVGHLNHYEKRIDSFFTVIRNPLTWYESWYKYQFSNNFRDYSNDDWHSISAIARIKEKGDFNVFMEKVNRMIPGFCCNLFYQYLGMNGNKSVTVLKTETLREDLDELNRNYSLGIPEDVIFQEPDYGVSPKKTIHWDPKILQQTIRNEKPFLQLFGYKKEDAIPNKDDQ